MIVKIESNFYLKWKSRSQKATVGRKIIRVLEIIRVKKLIPNVVLWNKYLSSHDFLGFILFITSMGWQNLAIKPDKNYKYYRKHSNSFAAECRY